MEGTLTVFSEEGVYLGTAVNSVLDNSVLYMDAGAAKFATVGLSIKLYSRATNMGYGVKVIANFRDGYDQQIVRFSLVKQLTQEEIGHLKFPGAKTTTNPYLGNWLHIFDRR